MILYIDTSDRKVVRVHLKNQTGKILVEKSEENELGSQVLLPLIVEILAAEGRTLQSLTAIEVKEGPGSFTGLRVGASVGQALGLALNIPVNGALNKPVELKYS